MTSGEEMTLSTLQRGAVEELFQDAVRELALDIRNPNKPATAARSLTITLTYVPDETRESAKLTTDVKVKLPAVNKASSRVFVGRGVMVEHDPQQLAMDVQALVSAPAAV